MELFQTIVAAAFTLLVLSYIFGDNPLYRFAMHALIGIGAAFAVAVAIDQVLRPSVWDKLTGGTLSGQAFGLFGLLGCAFMLAKLLPRVAWMGNVVVGYIVGVGVGVAVGGALIGTLIPQTLSSASLLDPNKYGPGGALGNLLILISTVTVLFAFTYARSAQRGLPGALSRVGRVFLYIALGATFALVFIASASVLSALVREWFNIISRPPAL